MKIRIFEAEPWECPGFAHLQEEHDLDCIEGQLDAAKAAEHADAEVISTFIYSDMDGDVLKQFNDLQLIATRSTGHDHIDKGYCEKHGISIANVPEYGQNTVAEHVFGLLLTLSHRLDRAIERTRRGDFSQKGLQGFDLNGKTLGVVGTGDIGQCVIRIARGFDMKVLAYDVQPDHDAAERLGFRYAGMDELLAESDVITLHVPGTPKTRHLIGEEELSKVKTGAVLINTSRGDVIDVRALVKALAEGALSGAGLDVLPEEPVIREEAELLRSVYQQSHNLETLLANHVVLRLRNVVVTPHSAFNTQEAVNRIIEETANNIEAFASGEARNIVNAVEPASAG